jgi:Na+/H+-dicarboxylate symporter
VNVQSRKLQSYFFPLILISSIGLGGLIGHLFPLSKIWLKPFGDIFINLIFTTMVPLIFFSVSSAIARAGSFNKLGRIMFYMMLVFLFTGLVAAIYTLFIVKIFPLTHDLYLPLASSSLSTTKFSTQWASMFTVSNFSKLLSHENILALIVFSFLVGLAVISSAEKNNHFASFLHAGEDIFMRVFSLIMYYAPIGFFAYFAVLVSELGSKLMESYVRITVIYYLSSLIYFFFAFSFYAYLAGKLEGVKIFWKNIFLPMTTSFATCSSAVSIPANLTAIKKMHVPPEIGETVIPIGAIIHKDGSVMGGVVKIAFLFALFHMNFTGLSVWLTAIAVSLLVGTVMGAIPSGGMLGELLILNVYGFPPSALLAIATISILIDPLATMLNVTGDAACGMMISRLVEGKTWLDCKKA